MQSSRQCEWELLHGQLTNWSWFAPPQYFLSSYSTEEEEPRRTCICSADFCTSRITAKITYIGVGMPRILGGAIATDYMIMNCYIFPKKWSLLICIYKQTRYFVRTRYIRCARLSRNSARRGLLRMRIAEIAGGYLVNHKYLGRLVFFPMR